MPFRESKSRTNQEANWSRSPSSSSHKHAFSEGEDLYVVGNIAGYCQLGTFLRPIGDGKSLIRYRDYGNHPYAVENKRLRKLSFTVRALRATPPKRTPPPASRTTSSKKRKHTREAMDTGHQSDKRQGRNNRASLERSPSPSRHGSLLDEGGSVTRALTSPEPGQGPEQDPGMEDIEEEEDQPMDEGEPKENDVPEPGFDRGTDRGTANEGSEGEDDQPTGEVEQNENVEGTANEGSEGEDDQPTGEGEKNETVEHHEQYNARNRLPKYLSLETIHRERPQVSVQPDEEGNIFLSQFDVDSFVFITQDFKDIRNLNSIEGITFNPAKHTNAPKSIRVALKKSKDKNFTPKMADGTQPKSHPTLDLFPGLNLATLHFKGGMNATLSLHLVTNCSVLGAKCPPGITATWNYAFNQTLTRFVDTSTFNDERWKHASHSWDTSLCGRMEGFDLEAVRENSQDGKTYGDVSIMIFEMIFEILGMLSRGQWSTPKPALVTDTMASLLVNNACIVIQSAGFKACWQNMKCSLGERIEPLPTAPRWRGSKTFGSFVKEYNQYLQRAFLATHKRAHTFFFKQAQFSDTAFKAIDIAVEFISADDRYHILPMGAQASHTIDEVVKCKKVWIQMPGDPPTPTLSPNRGHLDQRCHADRPRSDSDSASSGLSADSDATRSQKERRRAQRRDRGSQPDEDDSSSLSSSEQNYQFENSESEDESDEEGLPLADFSFPNPASITPGANQIPSEDPLDDMTVFERMLECSRKQYRKRTRYPLLGTSGRVFSNVQAKRPGLLLDVCIQERDQGQVLQLEPYSSPYACPIAQIYEPFNIGGLRVKTQRKLRKRARLIPQKISRLASHVEALIAAAHSGSSQPPSSDVFPLVKESFALLEAWLNTLDSHRMHLRCELTFASAMCAEHPDQIVVPMDKETSPLQCISYVARTALYETMHGTIQHHRRMLVDGFCSLESQSNLDSTTVPPEVWAAYVLAGEHLTLLLKTAGVGSRGSGLAQSLDKGLESTPHHSCYYDNHLWVVHPEFTVSLNPAEVPWETFYVREGVDPAICKASLEVPARSPLDSDNTFETNTDNFRSGVTWLAANLPFQLVESLRSIRVPSAFRKCLQLMFASFTKAGNSNAHPGQINIFQNVNWSEVGKTVQSVETALRGCADAILALYKVELADRIARFWQRNASDASLVDLHQATESIRTSNTMSEIQSCAARHAPPPVSPPFPHGIALCTVSTAAEIYTLITGYPGTFFPLRIPARNTQGWNSLGVPRCIFALGQLCRSVPQVPADVREAYGGRDPFCDLEVFQHYLASSLAALGNLDDPPFLFKTTPSELRWWTERPICLTVRYNPGLGMAFLRNPPSPQRQMIDPDQIKKNAFALQFLSFHAKAKKDLHIKLLKRLSLKRDQQVALGTYPYVHCHKILLLQAYIVYYYANGGQKHPPSFAIDPTIYSRVTEAIYPVRESCRKAMTSLMKGGSRFRDDLGCQPLATSTVQLTRMINSWEISGKDSNVLVKRAIQSLLPAGELGNLTRNGNLHDHQDALGPPPEPDKYLLLKLHKLQEELLVGQGKPDFALACYICCISGVTTKAFLDSIENLRKELREAIRILHSNPLGKSKDLPRNIVLAHSHESESFKFDFEPKS